MYDYTVWFVNHVGWISWHLSLSGLISSLLAFINSSLQFLCILLALRRCSPCRVRRSGRIGGLYPAHMRLTSPSPTQSLPSNLSASITFSWPFPLEPIMDELTVWIESFLSSEWCHSFLGAWMQNTRLHQPFPISQNLRVFVHVCLCVSGWCRQSLEYLLGWKRPCPQWKTLCLALTQQEPSALAQDLNLLSSLARMCALCECVCVYVRPSCLCEKPRPSAVGSLITRGYWTEAADCRSACEKKKHLCRKPSSAYLVVVHKSPFKDFNGSLSQDQWHTRCNVSLKMFL